MVVCPKCATQNPLGARFCNSCGAPIASEGRRDERRIVTVLFCDLVGFTARSERLDPEDVRALLAPYHEHLRSELERFGGTVEKFIGDAVMALFGAPVVHEDDPERGVRAALAIRDWAVEHGDDLHVRIAVNTGEALVTLGARPEEGEAMAAGDVINTAARMQAAAPVNGILVGEQTYHATAHAIDYAEAPPVIGKGKSEPILVWEALHARSRFGVDVSQAPVAPLVGRGHELELLTSALARVVEERSPQLVTLIGVPGIGKSRLVFELFQHVSQNPDVFVTWRQGRSLPYGDGVTFWALSEIVKAQAGILESDAPGTAERKLQRAIDEVVTESSEPRWIERHLRPLAGLSEERAADPHEAFAAWRGFIESLAEDRPLVLVFEDLHWADDALLGFVDQLVERAVDIPLLVVSTARPELLERRPGWGAGKINALMISLPPLSDEETAHLLTELLDRPVDESKMLEDLLARAGGNPLYAEQYARILRERGGLVDVPETVQGIIAARLDVLSEREKRLLQNAAVIGKVFWLGAVSAVGEVTRWQAEELLHGLERKEFVQRARRPSVAGEMEYAFRHVLIRDVAYGQIPRAARAQKHERAASWIESLGRPEDHAEMLSHHYMQALDYARASGDQVQTLAGRARLSLRDAGERASSLGAYAASAHFYTAALKLWPNDAPDLADLLFRCGRALYQSDRSGTDLLVRALERFLAVSDAEGAAEAALVLAEVFGYRGDRDAGRDYVERALRFLADRPMSAAKAGALIQKSAFCMRAGEYRDAIRFAREAFPMVEEPGLDALHARALDVIGVSRVLSGDAAGVRDMEKAVQIAHAADAFDQLILALNNLQESQHLLGQIDHAMGTLERQRRIGERYVRADFQRWVLIPIMGEHIRRGLWDEALAFADEFMAKVEEESAHYTVPYCLILRASIEHARGDDAAASAHTESALEIARNIKDAQVIGPVLEARACVVFAEGRNDEAANLVREALGLRSLAALVPAPTFFAWLIEFAWLVRDLGLGDELAAALRKYSEIPWIDDMKAITSEDPLGAVAILADLGSRPGEAFTRLRVAETLAAEGRGVESEAHLGKAVEFYRSVRATRFIRQAEVLMATLSPGG